ncbi:DnaA regulatory inactivator Hda [Rhodoferax sp. 4810]|nr:DnaA regulatory inactivator Hda [Rhodoferax jenense]
MKQLVLDMGLAKGPSLNNFCVGPNVAALAHLQLWLGQPGRAATPRSPVPTYLWGPSGCGKSHLLQAVRSALQAQGQRVGWLDATVSVADEFDDTWAAVLLDDVHAFDAAQQQAAFNWFVNAQTQQIAVLAAGSLPPADLKLRDDLRTRLGWGHVFALQTLDDTQRREVLRASAQARGIALSDEVMDFMLTRFSRDLGSLMELLDLMDGYALQTQRAITIPLIKTMMDNA